MAMPASSSAADRPEPRRTEMMKTGSVMRFPHRFARAGRAASALEYAILVGVVAAGIAGALVLFSGNITTAIESLGTAVGSIRAPAMPSLTP